jgi:hypothetical protein
VGREARGRRGMRWRRLLVGSGDAEVIFVCGSDGAGRGGSLEGMN